MGLFTVDEWISFDTRRSIHEIAAGIKGEGAQESTYLTLPMRRAVKGGHSSVEWHRLQSSSADAVFAEFESDDEPEIAIAAQYVVRKTGAAPWTLQAYAKDRGSHREVQLRIMGYRADAGPARRLAAMIQDALR